MNLSPELRQAIEQISASQGISPEQFIIQTLTEKANSLQRSTLHVGLREKDGILVFETESLDHIDFNTLIAQSREATDCEQSEL